jgi:hypothetical protein
MYLPAKDLRLLCQLCTPSKKASDVVSEFLTQTDRKLSPYRVIEALQYLLEQKVLHEQEKTVASGSFPDVSNT